MKLPSDFAKKIAECLKLTEIGCEEYFDIGEDKEGFFVAKLQPKKFLEKDQFRIMCVLVRELGGDSYLEGMKAWKVPGPYAKKSAEKPSDQGMDSERSYKEAGNAIPIEPLVSPKESGEIVAKPSENQFKSWSKMTEFLPALSKTEREDLRESIQKYGIKHRILVLSDGRIIDGFHRWQISQELKVECPCESVDLNDDDAFALGIALNLARRQLSFEQIKDIRERQRTIALELRKTGKTQEEVAKTVGVTQKTVSEWEENIISNIPEYNAYNPPDLRQSIPKSEYERIHGRVKSGEEQEQIAADYKISQERVSQIAKMVEAREHAPQQTGTPPFPDKKYRCLVIDPPWPVVKIEREERPNQGLELDYATMSLEEIEKIPIIDLANSEGCHIFLWVTHKFLPDGLKLFEKWGVKYQCVLTWVKPTGMTPFSWMYNTEHVLFGRIGNLCLLENGVKLSFEAPVLGHSKKPDKFYEIVRQVSPEPRLELFAREAHNGFESWGNEAE